MIRLKSCLIVALCFSLFTTASNPASAKLQDEFLVVIDTALNSDQIEIAGNIKYEVCILDWSVCPNGENFMEGKGSAYLTPRFISSNGFNHGTQMVSAALKTNPNLQIIFIRIVGNSTSGARLNVSPFAVAKALKWVSDNKERFPIGAVAMSQGHRNLSLLTRYCPIESAVESMVESLLQKGVPVFVPAGNSRDYERLDWPACIPSTISIGALTSDRKIASYGNLDPKVLDFFEVGEVKINDFDGQLRTAIGSSVSVQVAAAKWMKIIEMNPSFTYEQKMDFLVNNCTKVSDARITGALAFPKEIEDPRLRIELNNQLDQIRNQLIELQSVIYVLLAALSK
jgi:hypothetical protein